MPEMNNNNTGNPFPSTTSANATSSNNNSADKVEQLKEQQQKPFGFASSATNGLGPGAAITNPINPPKPTAPTSSFDSVKTFPATSSSSFGSGGFGNSAAAPAASSLSSSSFGGVKSEFGVKPPTAVATPEKKTSELPKPSFLADSNKPSTTSSFGGFSSSTSTTAPSTSTFKPATAATTGTAGSSFTSSSTTAPASTASPAKPFGSFGGASSTNAPSSAIPQVKKDDQPSSSFGLGANNINKPSVPAATTQSPAKPAFSSAPFEPKTEKSTPKIETAAKPVTAAASPASTASISSYTNPAKPFSASYPAPAPKAAEVAAPAVVAAVNNKPEEQIKPQVKKESEPSIKGTPSKKRTHAEAIAKEKPQAIRHSSRARTAVKLPVVEAPVIQEKKPIEIEQGTGAKFADIPHINKELGKRKAADKTITRLHQLLFGRPGEASKRKANLRQFNGTAHDIKERLDRLSADDLKSLCVFLNLERSGEKAALVTKIDAFLHSPKDLGESKPAPKAASKSSAKKVGKKAKKAPKKTAPKKKAAKGKSQAKAAETSVEKDQ